MTSPDTTTAEIPEREPQWYRQTTWSFGNIRLYYAASIAYLGLVLSPFAFFCYSEQLFLEFVSCNKRFVATWAAIATMAYPAWAWLEFQAFEPWVRQLSEKQRAIERAFYKSNNDLAKNFWTALFGIYATAGILLFLKH